MTNLPPAEAASGTSGSEPTDPFDDLYALNRAVVVKYHDELMRILASEPEHPVTQYVQRRGLTESDLKTFWIGYAPPSWDFLTNSLAAIEGILPHALDMGVITFRKGAQAAPDGSFKKEQVRDFFYDRLLFPLHDTKGHVVGFTGRTIGEPGLGKDGRKVPKYLNTAENAIFRKNELLFGWYRAIRTIGVDVGRRHAILTEGQTDVVALHRAGLTEAVAKSGTALTEAQLKILTSHCDSVTLIYDVDTNGVGQKTQLKDIDTLLAAGLRVKVFSLPGRLDDDGKPQKMDADSWISQLEQEREKDPEREAPDLRYLIKRQSTDALVDRATTFINEYDESGDVGDLAEARRKIIDLIASVKEEATREDYINKLSKKLTMHRRTLHKDVALARKKKFGAEGSGEAEVVDDEMPLWVEDVKDLFAWGFTGRVVKGDSRKTGYYFLGGGGRLESKPLTNFVITPLYHVKERGNAARLVSLNNGFQQRVIELPSQMLTSLQAFECGLADVGNFSLLEGFEKKHLIRIKNRLMELTPDVFPIRTMGYQPEGFFAFSNAVYKKSLVPYNEHGVVDVDEQKYFSPSLSPVFAHYRTGTDQYQQDRYLSYVEPPASVDFATWGKQLLAVYGERAMIGMLFAAVALFKDAVIRSAKVPLLYCYGPKDSGKSTFAESILYLFFSGKDSMGHLKKPLNFASEPTLSAFWSEMGRHRNCPIVCNEFDENTVKPEFKTALKSAWDNEGRQRMSRDTPGQMDNQNVEGAPIVVGQYLADSDDGSVVSRSVVLEFRDRKEVPFTAEETVAYGVLRAWEQAGLSGLLTKLLEFRPVIEADYARHYATIRASLHADLETSNVVSRPRMVQNMAALLAMYDTLQSSVAWPFDRESLWNYARKLISEMNGLMHEADQLVGFWTTLSYLFDRGKLISGWDFRVETTMMLKRAKTTGTTWAEHRFAAPKTVLYIRLSNVAIPYAEQLKNKGEKSALKESTLLVYMKQQPYWIGQVDRVYFAKPNGGSTSSSAFCLDYEMLVNRTGISLERISDEEIDIRTIRGIMIDDAISIPSGEGDVWQFRLQVSETQGMSTVQHKVKVFAPAHLVPDANLLIPGSRWRVTGAYTERPWANNRQQSGLSRQLDASSLESEAPGPVAGQIITDGFEGRGDGPF